MKGNQMKKYFEDPRFSLIRFSACDVIVTSGDVTNGDDLNDPNGENNEVTIP